MRHPEQKSGPEPARLRVLLADACPAVRSRWRAELERLPLIEVIGEAGTSDEALAIFYQARPDLAIVSVLLPGQGGFEFLRCVKRTALDSAVILTSLYPCPFTDQSAALLGAAGVCHVGDELVRFRGLMENLWERKAAGKVK